MISDTMWGALSGCMGWPGGTDTLEGKRPQRRPQQWLDRQLEEVAKAVGGSYCQLQMPLKLALAVRETVAGHSLGALEGGGSPPFFQCMPAPGAANGGLLRPVRFCG